MTSWQFAADAELRALLHIPRSVEIMATITLGSPAGAPRPGAPAPAPRAGVRGAVGEAPAWAVDPPGADAHGGGATDARTQ